MESKVKSIETESGKVVARGCEAEETGRDGSKGINFQPEDEYPLMHNMGIIVVNSVLYNCNLLEE